VVPDDAAGAVVLSPLFGGPEVPVAADLLVWHQPRTADDVLVRGLAPGASATAIGDCVTPRRISHAIAEGYRLGATL